MLDCTTIVVRPADSWRRCYDCRVDFETVEAIERLTERIESFEQRIESCESSIRTELRDGLAEVRRHSTLLNEATRDDIRLVAEAVAAMAVKIDSMQR